MMHVYEGQTNKTCIEEHAKNFPDLSFYWKNTVEHCLWVQQWCFQLRKNLGMMSPTQITEKSLSQLVANKHYLLKCWPGKISN